MIQRLYIRIINSINKRYISKFVNLFLFLCFLISIIMFFYSYSVFPTVKDFTVLHSSLPVTKSDEVKVLDGKNILVHNKNSGVIQCFDMEGNFFWGVQVRRVKNIEGTLISFSENKLFLWESYSNSVYTFVDFKLTNTEKKNKLYSETDFYKEYTYDCDEVYSCKLKRGKVIIFNESNKDEIKNVLLKTKYYPVSTTHYFSIAFISIFLFWINKKIKTG